MATKKTTDVETAAVETIAAETVTEKNTVEETVNENTTEVSDKENMTEVKEEEIKFKKSSFLDSKKYKKDLINALLEDDGEYTISEVDTIIDNFRKGKVN